MYKFFIKTRFFLFSFLLCTLFACSEDTQNNSDEALLNDLIETLKQNDSFQELIQFNSEWISYLGEDYLTNYGNNDLNDYLKIRGFENLDAYKDFVISNQSNYLNNIKNDVKGLSSLSNNQLNYIWSEAKNKIVRFRVSPEIACLQAAWDSYDEFTDDCIDDYVQTNNGDDYINCLDVGLSIYIVDISFC